MYNALKRDSAEYYKKTAYQESQKLSYVHGIGRPATVVKEITETGKKSLGINLTEHRLQLIDPSKRKKLE